MARVPSPKTVSQRLSAACSGLKVEGAATYQGSKDGSHVGCQAATHVVLEPVQAGFELWAALLADATRRGKKFIAAVAARTAVRFWKRLRLNDLPWS